VNPLLLQILIPAAAALLVLAVRQRAAQNLIALAAAVANVVLAALLFAGVVDTGTITFSSDWALDLTFALSLGKLNSFVMLAGAGFGLLVVLYCWPFMKNHKHGGLFQFFVLVSLGLLNGAVMADSLLVLLFFWEGMMGTLFGMIAIGRPGAWKTATKALIISGVTDLCLMLGIALLYVIGNGTANSLLMSHYVGHDALKIDDGLKIASFVLLMIGAISKAGSMPFHSWIPDAAVDAPLPFMVLLPASLEKLMGIYLLARICLDVFVVTPGGAMSLLMMIVGSATILLAVAMALVQKDFKRLLSFHAISQVGYMVLGVGTGLPIGIVGGVFHMINHAMYKSCLFMTAGSVERQAGTTDLKQLGGLGAKMPVTFTCFIIAAMSISGFPLTNGFYSKELVYAGAWESGWIFYVAAVLGTALTAASFLKLGHAAFLGKRQESMANVKEAPIGMTLPMLVLAGFCMLFGLYNTLPIDGILVLALPMHEIAARAGSIGEHAFSGLLPHDWTLAGLACTALALAFLNHLWGVKRSGSGLGAVDHIHHAPVLRTVYVQAEAGRLDPYRWGMGMVQAVAYIGNAVDWINDQVFESLAVGITALFSWSFRKINTGSYALYVLWSLAGVAALIWFLLA
jgi:formate hydrogenlyase subunit 3/multisubunit Na+/H+ antiporter MnhD subunit